MYRVVKETGQKAPGYAVVWCPDFRLQAVVRRVNWREEPVALVDDGPVSYTHLTLPTR